MLINSILSNHNSLKRKNLLNLMSCIKLLTFFVKKCFSSSPGANHIKLSSKKGELVKILMKCFLQMQMQEYQ